MQSSEDIQKKDGGQDRVQGFALREIMRYSYFEVGGGERERKRDRERKRERERRRAILSHLLGRKHAILSHLGSCFSCFQLLSRKMNSNKLKEIPILKGNPILNKLEL